MRTAIVALVILVAGCAAPGDDTGVDPDAPSPIGSVTTRAFDDCGSCYEPTVAWDPAGRIYAVSGGAQSFAVSTDGARTFSSLDAPEVPDGQAIAGDVVVQTDARGRLWWSDLIALGNGRQTIRVARSDDGGLSWPVNAIIPTGLDPLGVVDVADRQWVAFDGDVVYAVCTCPGVVAPRIARSEDDGATWSAWQAIETDAGRPGPVGAPIAWSGKVALPYLFGTTALSASDLRSYGVRVALSADGGATWETRNVFDAGGPDVACCAFPSMARGADGRLAIAWAMTNGPVYVATSEDEGTTWSEPIAYGEDGRYPHPWIAALPDGRFALSWFATAGDRVEARLALARPEDAAQAMPSVDVLGDAGSPNTDFAYLVASPDGDAVAVAFSNDGVMIAVRPVT